MSFDLCCRNCEGAVCAESFSRNNLGWGLIRAGLIEYGALGEDTRRRSVLSKDHDGMPKCPPRPDNEHFDDDDNGIDDVGRAYCAARDAFLSWKPEKSNLPPWHKFDDNSGWIVTEDECKAMLAAIARRGPPASVKGLNSMMWTEFIAFLGHCAAHGGFEVH